MDHEYFPYGNKNEKQLVKRLKYLLNKFHRSSFSCFKNCLFNGYISQIYAILLVHNRKNEIII